MIDNQNVLLILSIIYIYFLSDLLFVIDNNLCITTIIKLCIPIIINILGYFISLYEKYNVDFCEWWNREVSVYTVVKYVSISMRLIYDSGIFLDWNKKKHYCINMFFIFLGTKMIYNFINNLNIIYLLSCTLCIYSIYIKFNNSNNAFVVISSKFVELGGYKMVSENMNIVDNINDYCIKNEKKKPWIIYIIKLVIGYHGYQDTDSDEMAKELSEYIGLSYDECKNMYQESLVKKVSSAVETSKNVYAKIIPNKTKEI